jgi:hypothetical protein
MIMIMCRNHFYQEKSTKLLRLLMVLFVFLFYDSYQRTYDTLLHCKFNKQCLVSVPFFIVQDLNDYYVSLSVVDVLTIFVHFIFSLFRSVKNNIKLLCAL